VSLDDTSLHDTSIEDPRVDTSADDVGMDPSGDDRPMTRRESRLAAEGVTATTRRLERYRSRSDRLASALLVAAAVCVVAGGIVLALGFPRPHTLLVYAAVALGCLGVLFALPRVFSSVPFDSDRPVPRRRDDD